MAVIKVPKTPRSAFNKSRPLSSLLKAQVGILETLAGAGSARAAATAMPQTTMPRTEGEAAQYMATLAARVYPNIGEQSAAVPAGPVAAAAPRPAAPRPAAPRPVPARRPSAAPAKRKAARSRKAAKRKGAKKAAKRHVAKRHAAKRKGSGARRGGRAKTMKRRARR